MSKLYPPCALINYIWPILCSEDVLTYITPCSTSGFHTDTHLHKHNIKAGEHWAIKVAPSKLCPCVFVPVINRGLMRVYSGHFYSRCTYPGLEDSQADKSKLFAFVLVCAKWFRLNPPSSQLGPNVRPFHSQSGEIFVSSSFPNTLDIVKINCLAHWANVLPPGVIQMYKTWLSVFSQCEFPQREGQSQQEENPIAFLFNKGLTNPPPACKIAEGVNLAIKLQLRSLLTCKFFSPCHSAIEPQSAGPNL